MIRTVDLNKAHVRQIIKDIENQNGTKIKDFPLKEIVIIFHKDAMDKYNSIDEKLDKRIEWGQKAISNHDKLIQDITNKLPEKGFCDKMELIHADWFKNPKNTIGDKVDTLWYDRKIMKWILGAAVGALLLSGANLIFNTPF